jgi:tetratricopeptide (TPR) repeat protein
MTIPFHVRTHLGAGQPAAALHLLTEHLTRHPRDAASWEQAALALLALGRADDAVEAATQAVHNHGLPQHHALLALALARAGRTSEAVAQVAVVLEVEPMWPEPWERLGETFEAMGLLEDGLVARREALRRNPGHVARRLRLAERLERADHRDEARALVEGVLAKGRNTVAERILMRIDHHDGNLDAAADRARRLLGFLPSDQRRATWMELARIEARRGDADAAFEAASRGNRAALGRWIADGNDPDAWMSSLGALADVPVGPYPRATPDGAAFVVGFPRSGTTLLQQLLESHPQIRTLDEQPILDGAVRDVLPGANLPASVLASADPVVAARIREGWWARVEHRLPPTDGWVVDKLPLNLLRVDLLANVFPSAPIVVVLRDPRDAVLSSFLQDFDLTAAMAQCADLHRCAALYATTFGRWLQVRGHVPNAVEVRYEDVVTDPQTALGPVFDAFGLPWDDAVLDHAAHARDQAIGTPSYRDVRTPLYARSVGRWKAFRRHLEPVLPVLEPFVRALGYEV